MISIATSLSKFHRMQKTLSQHCCRSHPSKYHSIFESTVHVAVVMVQSHSQTPDYQSGNEAMYWLVPFSAPTPLSECTTCRCSNETMCLAFLFLQVSYDCHPSATTHLDLGKWSSLSDDH